MTGRHRILLTDFTHYQQALTQVKNLSIRCLTVSLYDEIGQLLLRMGLKRIGFDPYEMRYQDYWKIKRNLPNQEFIPISRTLNKFREVKDKEELECLRKAADICDAALTEVTEELREGMTEGQIAARLDNRMREYGAETTSFETMVLSGERTSFPHARTSGKKIRKGELIVIDAGARYQRYHSDCTRTFTMGSASAKKLKIYDVIKSALDISFSKIKPGIRCMEIDRAARSIISKNGYEEYFQHPLGHGIGLEIHESPFIDPENNEIIVPGMVFSLEPGIYIPGWGGIRIEELILVNESGAELITSSERCQLRSL